MQYQFSRVLAMNLLEAEIVNRYAIQGFFEHQPLQAEIASMPDSQLKTEITELWTAGQALAERISALVQPRKAELERASRKH